MKNNNVKKIDMTKKVHWQSGNMLYPLPAVMVSCKREGEKPNIITVAWTGTVCTNPAMVYISVRPSRYSYDIIKETKEFVINLTTKDLVKATDYCGVKSGRDVDKFEEMHLTVQESQHIKAPGIAQSPVNIECVVEDIKELGSHHMFLAKVVGVSVAEELIGENKQFHLEQAGLINYSHGAYFTQGEAVGSFGYAIRKKPASKKKAGHKKGKK